ncbi:PRD domain-containing protein [Intestinibacillus massiliensis]|uniref:BglG family transcription antiterminator LicT n=1 Tax=Intestinibacillus massiliensis TaxID=1871029 RepID=UPI000B359BF5|nr:PRD domain-containing protein [Intestinibacillus massiliensis]MCB6365258.1 PRD domain-containing protein [Intestinibacillus massiliensis]
MKIEKVLNNNVAVTRNEQGREVIVMGRGLAFKGKPGDGIDPEKIEKTFIITDEGVADKFQQLLANIPMAHMLMSERIINYAKIKLGKRLNDSIYVTLPDHISTAIYRYKEGILLKNPLMWDIRRFYRDEYEVGRKANQIVLEETGVEFLEDEAAFIAMHFVNAQLGEQMSNVYDITYIMQEVCNIVKNNFQMEFDEDSLDYYRFITHLKFFAQRLRSGTHYEDDDTELLEVIRYKHRDAYECTEKIKGFVQEKYKYELGSEEMLYLTVHIARLTRKTNRKGVQ